MVYIYKASCKEAEKLEIIFRPKKIAAPDVNLISSGSASRSTSQNI